MMTTTLGKSSYRTTSTPALCILANMLPLEDSYIQTCVYFKHTYETKIRVDEKIHLLLNDLTRVYPGKGKEKSPLEWSSYLNE